jgi:DNA-binding LacI/PurR family transcriptional regulator
MSKRVSIKNIAEELGISIMTVSRALNNRPNVDEKTRGRVVEAVRRLGYIPNSLAVSLAQRKTYTIGVVVPEITNSFFYHVISGIEEIAYSQGYQLMLNHSAEDANREISAIQTLASKRVDGLLVSVANSVKDYSIYKQIIKLGMPVVFFDRCISGIGASCIRVNDMEGAKAITNYLISLGHKRIANLCGPQTSPIGRARLEGFKMALKENNIKPVRELIVESGLRSAGGYEAMKNIFRQVGVKLPTAVCAVADPAAFGAMKAIKEAGLKVPDDISVVGFSDDIRAQLVYPSLTTVRQPAYEVGFRAAQKLIAHIEDKDEAEEEIIIKTELVIRQSCKTVEI